jgi:hypothetical protein
MVLILISDLHSSPSLLWLIWLVIPIIILLYFIYSFRSSKPKELAMARLGYKSEASLSAEDDFVNYLHTYAKQKKISSASKEQAFQFFENHLEEARLGYVVETGRTLSVNNSSILTKARDTWE